MTELVDSRLAGHRGRITHPTLPLERTFCANCGRPKGWVSFETGDTIRAEQIVVLCEDCEEKYGKPLLAEAPIREEKT